MPNTRKPTPRTIRQARDARDMSLQELRDQMMTFLPARLVPSVSKLNRMETGDTRKLDTLIVCAIARVLGCPVSSLSPEAAEELEAMRDLAEHTSPCITGRA